MRRLVVYLRFALLFSTLSSCILFTAESDFYVENESSHTLTLSWVNDEDKTESLIVPANETALLENSVMGETNEIKPSHVFKSIRATANISGNVVFVYTQDPINNTFWKRTSGSKDQYFIYTLKLIDSDLNLP
ncbi:hypothetical protein MASR2M78_14950 [Treponema sp.]